MDVEVVLAVVEVDVEVVEVDVEVVEGVVEVVVVDDVVLLVSEHSQRSLGQREPSSCVQSAWQRSSLTQSAMETNCWQLGSEVEVLVDDDVVDEPTFNMQLFRVDSIAQGGPVIQKSPDP